MEHEDFPVAGYEFMNEPATDEQKKIIIELANELGFDVNRGGPWPDPFSKWDASRTIRVLQDRIKQEQELKEKTLAEIRYP